jgi:hypothetical protein
MIGLVVGHVPCALDHQRRLREARAERLARAAMATRRSREGRPSPPAETPPGAGEDVWQALRF